MPSYPHTTFSTIITNPDGSTAGVDIPDPQFTDEEKAVIQLALDDENILDNPVEGKIAQCISAAGVARGRLNYLNGLSGGVYQNLLSGSVSLIDELVSDLTNSWRRHTSRISGASGGEFYDVMDGDKFGFNALQGIASAYNGARDAMRADDDPVVDNYSPHFSAILDSGNSFLSDVSGPSGIFGEEGWEFGGYAIGPDVDDVMLPTDVIPSIQNELSSINIGGRNIVTRDCNYQLQSVRYLNKYSRGNMVLGMNKDAVFGGVLLDNLSTDLLDEALAAVVDV